MALGPQLKDSTTWDGRPAVYCEIEAHQTYYLYIVKFRKERNVPCAGRDDITRQESSQYVKVVKRDNGSWVKHFSGHDSGSLHSISAGCVLTWRPEPFDEIVHAIPVHFSGVRHLRWSDDYPDCDHSTRWLSASIERGHRDILISCGSTPGRSPMLGEDGQEDAYGHDSLSEFVERFLETGEWGDRVMCEVSYVVYDNYEAAFLEVKRRLTDAPEES